MARENKDYNIENNIYLRAPSFKERLTDSFNVLGRKTKRAVKKTALYTLLFGGTYLAGQHDLAEKAIDFAKPHLSQYFQEQSNPATENKNAGFAPLPVEKPVKQSATPQPTKKQKTAVTLDEARQLTKEAITLTSQTISKVPEDFLDKLIKSESGYNPNAGSVDGPCGAGQIYSQTQYGLMARYEDKYNLHDYTKGMYKKGAYYTFKQTSQERKARALCKNPFFSVAMAAEYVAECYDRMHNLLGRAPNYTEAKLCYFLGLSNKKGGPNFVKAYWDKNKKNQLAGKFVGNGKTSTGNPVLNRNKNIFFVNGNTSKPRTVEGVVKYFQKDFGYETFPERKEFLAPAKQQTVKLVNASYKLK